MEDTNHLFVQVMKCKFFWTSSPTKVQMCRALHGILGWFISLSWSQHMDTLKTKQLWGGGGEVSGSVSCVWVLVDYCPWSLAPSPASCENSSLWWHQFTCLSCEGRCPMLYSWLHSPSNLQCLDSSLCSVTFLYPSKPQVILPLQLTMYLGHLFFQCCVIVFPWGHISPRRDLSSWRMRTAILLPDSPEQPLHLPACSVFLDNLSCADHVACMCSLECFYIPR